MALFIALRVRGSLWVDGTRKGNCEGVVFGVDGTCEGIEKIRGDLLWTVFAVGREGFIMRQLGPNGPGTRGVRIFQAFHDDEDCFGDSGCRF